MRALVVALVVCVAGCALDGRRLPTWTLDVEDGPHNTTVTLPSTLLRELPLRKTSFVLGATVPLQSDERGHELTLIFDCFHGAIAVAVDGHALEDHGDAGVGEHVYVIPAAATDRPELALSVTAHHDPLSSFFGFGAPPRLVVGEPNRAPAVFDRYFAVAEIIVISVLGLLFGTLYLLDRRRRADGAFAVQALPGLVVAAWQLGLLARLGALGFPLFLLAIVALGLSVLAFLHLTFAMGRYPRKLMVGYIFVAAGAIIGAGSWPIETAAFVGMLICAVFLYAHVIPPLVRLSRSSDARIEARLMLTIIVGAVFWSATTARSLTGRAWFAGWHFESVAIFPYAIAQSIILARQHVARSREVERANVELQHQVAARSKELADALAKLASQPRTPGGADQIIDGRYRVVRKLGAGGMGEVHEVERISDRARFALKRLRGRADVDALARFAREAQIAAELHHPNLVPVVDVGIADGELFLVMPLVDGDSLEAARGKFGTDLPWTHRVLAEVATGLAALHDRGIVHRDLKPGNILLSGGVARIADFGLAHLADAGEAEPAGDQRAVGALDDTVTGKLGRANLTRAGDVFGTPSYMAPELARGVQLAAPASDVFAFGVIAFELATGRAPFRDPPVVVMLKGGTYAPPDTSSIEPSLRATVARCLAADPAARPTTRDLVAALTA